MNVYADNTELNPETTKSATWQIVKPAGLEPYIIITRAEWPSVNDDFFSGFSTFFQTLGANWNAHGKVVNGNGPANKNGILASYWFKINPGFVGQTNFDINPDNTDFGDSQANPQLFSIENTAFTVLSNDTIPPVVTLFEPQDSQTMTHATMNFSATFTDNENLSNATLYVWNSTGNVVVQQTTLITGTSDSANLEATLPSGGTYHWNYLARDLANNMAFADTNFTVIYNAPDTTAPSVSILYPSAAAYTNQITQLNYAASDDVALDSCWYSLDNGVINTSIVCGANATGLNSGEGNSIWRVYANDTSGNVGSASVTFFVDSIAPLVSYGAFTELNNSLLNRNNIVVNATASDTNLGSVLVRLFNFGMSLIMSATTTTSPNFVNFTGLPDGVYYFDAVANDTLNNFNIAELRTVRIDTTAPLVTINSPLNVTYTSTSLVFNVTLNEQGSVDYSLDNGVTNVTMTSSDGLHFTSPATLGNGVYTFRVYARDSVGNTNNAASVVFSVNTDVTPPKVTIKTPLNITYNVSSIVFKVTLNEQGSEVKYSLDNGVTNVTMTRSATNKTFTSTASVNNGAYTFRAYAKDLAGNQNNTAKISFSVNVPQKRVFVTSFTIPNPNFINTSGADAYCTQAKTQAGLNGTFIAWVSFNGTNAKDRVLDMKYVRMDGATVASSKSDLVDGSVANPISVDEYGNSVPSGTLVITGTKNNGLTANNICNNWQGITNTSTKKGAIGNAFYTNKSWTYDQAGSLCKNMFNTQRLYCFEI